MMRVLVLSCSMNPESRSARLAERAMTALERQPVDVDARLIDLRHRRLPVCDGAEAHADAGADEIRQAIERADAVILALAVYNYGANAAAKNVIELTGKAWHRKVVGFLCAAGGSGSYMSVMPLANSLMLDFRCLIVPDFVYATKQAFDGPRHESVPLDPIPQRIDALCAEVVRLGQALRDAPAPQTPDGQA